MDKRIFMGALLMLSLGILINCGSAQLGGNLTKNESDDIGITVNVSTECMIDVQPAALMWVDVSPGGVGDNDSEVLGANFYAIQIENIGSRNISRVWFNATYPSATPFARGSAAFTDAGNYVVLSNSSSKNAPDDTFWFINRVEFNETRELVYIRDPNGNLPPDTNTFTYGRFRNSTNEYFWMYDQTFGNCNASGTLYIGTEPHTRTQTGTTNFQSQLVGGAFTTTPLTTYNCAGLSYAVGEVNSSSPLYGYEVAMSQDCRLFFSRWNRDCPFDRPGTEAVFATDVVDFPTATLYPGDSIVMAIKVYIPYGIYEGQSNPGKIWAIATAA